MREVDFEETWAFDEEGLVMKDDVKEEHVAEEEEAFVEEACRTPKVAVRTCRIGREAYQEAYHNSNQTSPSAREAAFVEAACLVAAQDGDVEQDEGCP
jgi:tellurite resistance protein